MITYQEALKRAINYLANTEFPVVITMHGRFAEGWYFCFEAREFLETGDEAARLAGNAPFIIDKDSGEIHSLGTAKPLEEYLQDYEIKKASFGLP
ncbi:YrhB family protein [Escherichia fergusonii]|uniref:YrhB family protein n=1 Tax=Escherichia fergusonii TaxID=564 RepID=UPI001E3BE1A2|nr:YrhB family protein [Escherichia fergusonii]MCC8283292.1 YrhB family protein [Escherichia fergusonii]MCC8288883.1 YrhB family protein [Escherichia fergusonii]MCC8318158.1 YrhB family protein [Escherichia fergusonii]